jgi:hypothetical protein
MKFQGLNTFDILHDHTQDIPDMIARINREQQTGNVLLLISGKAQTGKSNYALWLGEELKRVGKKVTITFSIYDFFDIATNTTRTDEVIIYDEVQQDIKNWWDLTYRVLKQILESYGYLHHTLIVITPRQRNVYSLFDLFHFLIKCRKQWIGNRFIFHASGYILDTDIKGKPFPIGFSDQIISKVENEVWNEYMKLKESNYEKRSKEWINLIERYREKNLQKETITNNPVIEEKDYYIENGIKKYFY